MPADDVQRKIYINMKNRISHRINGMGRKGNASNILKLRPPIVLGFLPESDCAPIVMAEQLGLFRKYDLRVSLQREMSWKNIQDKIISGEFDAAHAPGALTFLINAGFAPEECDCLSAMVLSLQGNAITISRQLWSRGVRDAETLGKLVAQDRDRRSYTFGVSAPLASQYSLMCQWLRTAEIPPSVRMRIISVPPAQMYPMLKLGYLDGFCGGEPWNSLATQAGVGVCVSTSAQLAPLHPEKTLLARRTFTTRRAAEHERLIAALIEACAFCDRPENRRQICSILALPHYVNAPIESLEPGLVGPFACEENPVRSLHGLHVFSRYRANEPTRAKADWITSRLYEFLRWTTRPSSFDSVFRLDIFRRAQTLIEGYDLPERKSPRPSVQPHPMNAMSEPAF